MFSRDEKSDEHIAAVRKLRSELLGKPEDMTSKKAVKVGSEYIGGINFERHDDAKSIKTGPRCYQLATTVQAAKSMSAPGAQGKVCHVAKDADAKMRFNLLKVSTDHFNLRYALTNVTIIMTLSSLEWKVHTKV
jgi:hypothetical protein